MVQQLSTNTFTTAKWIVSPTASDGTHTTIASALTSASSGDTIFIRPGTYTEDLTLKAGVNLSAFPSDDYFNGQVTIKGNSTASFTGSCTISGICLQTNGAAFLTLTGSNSTLVNLINCQFLAGTSAITFDSTSASSSLVILNCQGNITTTGIAFFTMSCPGGLTIEYSRITNSGASTTAATASAGTCNFQYNEFDFAITTSSTNFLGSKNNNYNCASINTTAVTFGGSGANNSTTDYYAGGTASAISIGSSLTLHQAVVNSSNTNAITGAGSLTYAGIAFQGSSFKINTTTQTGGILQGGLTQAPSAGFIGERLVSSVGAGTVNLVSNTPKTVTSVSITAGIWDLYTMCVISGTLQTRNESGPSAVDNTLGAGGVGIDTSDTPTSATAAANVTSTVAGVRIVLTATTTYYLVANSIFTGSASAGGKIVAVRVG